ncbi:MAG: hypothetical protein EOM87_09360 [Clostridia bacterium]|nr:hypothetical protein [Clostridia bacterium]
MAFFKKRWAVPSKRAKGYASERKAKVHQHGPKEGKELTDYEAGIRSGYLQCQTDHSGIYNYKKAKEAEKATAAAKPAKAAK